MATWLVVTGIATAVDSAVFTNMVETPAPSTVTVLANIGGCAVSGRFLMTVTTPAGYTIMIVPCANKCGGIMAIFADIRSRYVICRFTNRIPVIVATYAVTGNVGVIKLRALEGCGVVTIFTGIR
jgi:hypothetical protein